MALTLAENDFDFYLRFAKPLVLNLSEPNDKALAAAWIQKLRDENVGDLRLRTDYLKLLLFVLQRNKLIGTFAGNPNAFQKLDEFPETDLKNIAKELLESEEELRKKKRKEGGDFPPYATEHSADLLEYAAAQEIPNFGVQAYYAISNDPLPLWSRTENAIFPRGAFSATDQTPGSRERAIGETVSEPNLPQKKVQFKFESKTKMKTPTLYSSYQSRLPGPHSPQRAEPCGEERTPLTWGSNLIGVTDPTPHEYQPIVMPDEDSDVAIGSNRPYYNPEVQPGEDFFDGSRTMQSPREPCMYTDSRPHDNITARDFEPFDTMLENYDRDEQLPTTTLLSAGIPSTSIRTAAKTSKIPHAKGSRRRSPSNKLTKETRFDEVDLFHLQTQQASPSMEDFSLPLRTPTPRKPQQLSKQQRRLFSPSFLDEEEQTLFVETPPSFIDDSNLLSIESLEDPSLPLKTPSPRRPHTLPTDNYLYMSNLPEDEQEQIFAETPPNPSLPIKTPSPQKSPKFDDFGLPPVYTFRDKRVPIRTPRHLKTTNAEDLSLESLPYLTPSPRQYDSYSLPLKTPTPRQKRSLSPQRQSYSPQLLEERTEPNVLQTIPTFVADSNLSFLNTTEDFSLPIQTPPRQKEIFIEDSSLASLPYLTPTPRRIDDVSLPLRTPSPKAILEEYIYSHDLEDVSLPLRTPSPKAILEQYIYSPDLPDKEGDLLFAETPPSFFNESNGSFIDALEEPSLPLQTPPRLETPRQTKDVNLQLKTPTPRKTHKTPQQLYSSKPPEIETENLEKPSFYQNYNREPQDTLADISFPSRTPSPHRATSQPGLLEMLGLSTDQMQVESDDATNLERRQADEIKFPLVKPSSPAAQDIIEEFNEQNISQNQVLPSESQLNVRQPKPRRGIPRRVVPTGSAAQIPQIKRKEQYQQHVGEPQLNLDRPRQMIPRRSQIARPKRKLVIDKKGQELTLDQAYETPKSSRERTPSPRRLHQIDLQPPAIKKPPRKLAAFPEQTSDQPYPMDTPKSTRQRTHSPKRLNLDQIDTDAVIKSPRQASPSRTELQHLQSEPKTPSPRRQNADSALFTTNANESFARIHLESPPQGYESPEVLMSPNESFGLPRPIRVADLSPILHSQYQSPYQSPYQSTSQGTNIVQQTDQVEPGPSGFTKHQTSTRVSELTTDSLSARVAQQVETMLRELEEPFQKKWTLPELSDESLQDLEESFEFPLSPDAVSPVKEFQYLPSDDLQTEIDHILSQTPPTIAASPQKTPALFERTENISVSDLYTETPPRIGYESPKTPPGYQSPSAFFQRTPPREEFELPEFIESQTFTTEKRQHIDQDQMILSPDSSIESPRTLRNRLRRTPYSEYGGRNTILAAPNIPTLRELPDNYQEEDMPFLENVQRAKSRWNNRRNRLQRPPTLDEVLESPVRVPTMFEVEDTTGIRQYREELEEQYSYLPEPEENLPSSQPLHTSYARDEPYSLWTTPPQYKFKHVEIPARIEIGSPLSPSKPDEFLDEEELPPNIMLSPEHISSEELNVIQLTKNINDILEQDMVQTGNIRSHLLEITDDESQLNIESEEFPADIIHSPPPLSPELKTPPPRKLILQQPRSSPTSPFRATTSRQISPTRAYSPAESPVALKIRMFQADEPPYYSLPEVEVLTGKTKSRKTIVKRGLQAPKHYTLREEIEGYSEEHVPFRSQVESSQRKFTKPRRKIKMSKTVMEDIRESPIRVPHVTEVEDTTGFRREREQIEQRLSDLPEIEYQYPEELFGIAANLPEQQRGVTILDTTPPKKLPTPIRPKAEVPGWKTPPQYKTTPIQKRLPFSESVELYEHVISEELLPTAALYSPPQISPADRDKLKASFITPKQSSQSKQFTPPKQSPLTFKQHEKTPPFSNQLFERIAQSQDEVLDEELIPDHMTTPSPIRNIPTRVPRAVLSPISSPESPGSLHLRIFQQPEPPYYSKPSMDVLVGTGKRYKIKRRSRAPKFQKVREVPEDFPEEQLPFLTQVETAGKLPQKRRRRVQQPSEMESVRESPIKVPYWIEMEDVTGFRKIREAIEARCADLPELPTMYPENLIDSTIMGEWQQGPSELDTSLPKDLPSPLQPISEVPGWKTPPNLKISKKPTHVSEDYKFTLQPDLFYEMIPTEMTYSPPPLSPKTPKIKTPQISKQTTFKRQSPKVTSPLQEKISLLTFEQLEKKAAMQPRILEFETLSEDYLLDESPVVLKSPQKTPQRTVKPFKSKTLSFADKYLAQEATKMAYEELMQEQDGTLPPHSQSLIDVPVSSHKPKTPEAIIEDLNKSLDEFEALEAMHATDSPTAESSARSHDVHSHLQLLNTMDRIGKQVRELHRKPTYYERIEDLIYDVPDPHLARPPPLRTPVLAEFKSPPWSPKTLTTSRYQDLIEDDILSEEILNYQSPKTPSPRKPSPKTPKHSPAKSKPIARNLFDEFETAELLDDADFPEEQLLSSPRTPSTPPMPPRLEDFYDVMPSPKTPKSPDLTEKLKQHRYTRHRYDTGRKMMSQEVQIKNKRVPVRKSVPPKVSTIYESKEEGTNIPPRTTIITEEIIEVKPIPSILPEFTPIELDFSSPVKIQKVEAPPKYVYTEPYSLEKLYSTSPPKYFLYSDPVLQYDEIVEFPEFPSEEEVPGFIRKPQAPDYTLPRASYFGSPGREYIRTPVRHRPYYDFDDPIPQFVQTNQQTATEPTRRVNQPQDFSLPRTSYFGSPGREYIRTPVRHRPYYDFDDPIPQFAQTNQQTATEPTRRVNQPQDFSLPRPVYFGSPGREYIRTPNVNRQYRAPRIAESVTVTEYREPFEDFNLRFNPDVLDTCSIQVVEDDIVEEYR